MEEEGCEDRRHSHPELIMGDRVERLLEVHKAHIEWLLVLACLVHQYSEIRDLISCPPALSESRLFICNFRFGLYSDPLQYDPKKDLACVGDKSNCSVIWGPGLPLQISKSVVGNLQCLQCFDTVGWATGRASSL